MIQHNPTGDAQTAPATATGWPGYTPEDLAWFAANYADTEWAVHVIGPDDVHINEPDAQGEHNPDGAPLTERTAWALADQVHKFNAWYRATFGEKPAYTEDLIPNVFHRGVLVETRPEAADQVPGERGTAVPRTLVFADEDDAVHLASGDRAECGAPGGGRATCLASVTCRDCLDAFHAPGAPRGFRVGDLVEITGRGDIFDGKVGVVAKVDADPQYPMGLTVEGFAGLVWCNSTEVRHVEPARAASATGASATCGDCDGAGVRPVMDPVDPEFEAEEPCEACDGAGRALPDLAALAMCRPSQRPLDACLIRFQRRGTEVWADFFDADGDAVGTTPHPGDRSVAELVAHYEERGWAVAEPAADGAAR